MRLVNQYFGEWAYKFEMSYTYPKWRWLLAKFGTTPEAVFGNYSPENAIPWYTVMFVIACILSVIAIWMLKGKLSEDEPGHGQLALETGVLAVRSMLEDIRAFVERWLPCFVADNRSYLTVAIGCTGGKHRSVYFVEALARHFGGQHRVLVRHRELS